MKKRVIGIVLIVIDIMAILGGFVNGSWAALGDDNIITAATQVIVPIVIFVIAIILIVKSKKTTDINFIGKYMIFIKVQLSI